MPRMTVHMFGIMYFDFCVAPGATVLVPDGSQGDEHVPPHHASLYVEYTRLERHDESWQPILREVPILTIREKIVMVPMLEFRISSFSRLEFPADHRFPEIDTRSARQALVDMEDASPGFKPDFENVREGSIAMLRITSGTLEAFTFNRNLNALQWTIRSGEEPLKITAGDHSLYLKPRPESSFGTEVVFTNTPDLLSDLVPGANLPRAGNHGHRRRGAGGHGPGGHGGGMHGNDAHHFGLLKKIDIGEREPRLPRYRTAADYSSPLMAAAEDTALDSSCTPPCCKPGSGA